MLMLSYFYFPSFTPEQLSNSSLIALQCLETTTYICLFKQCLAARRLPYSVGNTQIHF